VSHKLRTGMYLSREAWTATLAIASHFLFSFRFLIPNHLPWGESTRGTRVGEASLLAPAASGQFQIQKERLDKLHRL
jgi:hypothetical protein